MGIVNNWVVKAGQKAGDRIASLSQLSPEQLSQIQIQKDKYMSEKPDPDDPQAVELTARLMAENGVEIFNSYLSQIRQLYIPLDPMAEYGRKFEPNYNIRYFNITKWVIDKEENSLEKLVNVYAVLSNEDCNIALVFNRLREKTNVYLAVVNVLNRNDNYEIDSLSKRIESAIRGNFPGSEIGIEDKKTAGVGRIPCLNKYKNSSVAIASNVPTEKSEKFISQTIEKLLDGYVPKNSNEDYTIVLLATPVTDVEERKQELARIYSGLVPYSQWSTNYTYTQADSTTGMAIVGVNIGASAGIQRGTNETLTSSNSRADSIGESQAQTDSTMKSSNESVTDTTSNNSMITDSISDTATDTVGTNESTATALGTNSSITNSVNEGNNISGTIGFNQSTSGSLTAGIPNVASANASFTNGMSESLSTGHSTSLSEALSQGTSEVNTATYGSSSSYAVSAMSGHSTASGVGSALAKTAGASFAKTVGRTLSKSTSRAITNGLAKAAGIVKGTNLGVNAGVNFARSSSVTATIGKNEGITQNFANFEIIHALEVLKEQMNRFETGSALGMWDFAAYVLSDDFNIANNVAHSYLALTQGEDSYMSDCAVNLWRNDIDSEKDKAKEICSYLLDLRHPQFGLNPTLIEQDSRFLVYPAAVTATATLSGKELAYSLNFPRKSIAGLPVFECAEFGRNVSTFEMGDYGSSSQIELGNIVHMHNVEDGKVNISLNSLAAHTFIAGSTGSGKSNTIYHILDSARKKGVHFLVVEPAKGEYKNVFGKDKDVHVYGTNPILSSLLRINPFSFPDKIHVLEHLDRLVEIFNVCWPMYAAMPVVLKSAVEKSYIDCGWDLITSTNKYDSRLYPNFSDVARNIKTIIDSSEYDDENKGAYKGALLTRLNSLATGINGLIFSSDELSTDELFDMNVVIDLSRVGSSETKSLIMGMVVLKLQEYRMNENAPMNSNLRHITVLEEAHNLLRRTSIDHPSESSNILGKSVELLANAIAEMRTYGEGFIIADQAPGLMDMSVIRNTNTKLIMRLPDQEDRELVGKAANLNEDQIIELAKLPRGVAAIYQNEWVQPVLCMVKKYEGDFSGYVFDCKENNGYIKRTNKISESLINCIMSKELYQIGDKQDLRELKDILIRSRLSSVIKADFIEYIETSKENGMEALSCLLYDCFNAEDAIKAADEYNNIHEFVDAVIDKIGPSIKEYSKEQISLAIMLVLNEQVNRDKSYSLVLNSYIEEYRKGGVL
jgi:DNA helicase HerA-like ATPase